MSIAPAVQKLFQKNGGGTMAQGHQNCRDASRGGDTAFRHGEKLDVRALGARNANTGRAGTFPSLMV